MVRKWICCLGVAASLLVFARPSSASTTVCGLIMTTPDCQPVPAEYQWAPDSQPTFAVGCLGYPSPNDAGQAPTPIVPSGSSLKLKLEAASQEITGGTFSETGIRCGEPCDPDAGWRSCNPSTLVRYSGPLAQGQQHKITLTNAGGSPYCLFNVSGVPVEPTAGRDAGAADGPETDLLSADALSETSDLSPLLREDALASDRISDVGLSADGPSADSPSADGSIADGSSVFPSADSPRVDVGPTSVGGTGVVQEGEPPAAGCSCTIGRGEQLSLKLVALLALFALTRIRRRQR